MSLISEALHAFSRQSVSIFVSCASHGYFFYFCLTAYRKEKEDLHLTGLEAFSFDYRVEWPVSLILSRKVIFYMLCFDFIKCKYGVIALNIPNAAASILTNQTKSCVIFAWF